MTWNEPGGDKKDPWSGRNDKNNPPDLDEVIRSIQEKFGNLFGGGSNNGSGAKPADGFSLKNLAIIIVAALIFWLASGIYTVDEGTTRCRYPFRRLYQDHSAGFELAYAYSN